MTARGAARFDPPILTVMAGETVRIAVRIPARTLTVSDSQVPTAIPHPRRFREQRNPEAVRKVRGHPFERREPMSFVISVPHVTGQLVVNSSEITPA
jgi:hypothetical protein